MGFIEGIWIALGCVWILSAAGSKPTARRQSTGSRVGQVAILFLGSLLLTPPGSRFRILTVRFVPEAHATILAGVVVTAFGAAVAMWARLTLGANWSGTVTVKQDHELIRGGPYRFVRHPIYSGLLLAVLGTAIAVGEIRGLIALAAAFLGFWWKSRTEEGFMMELFGDRYAQYRREVKALIPFVF